MIPAEIIAMVGRARTVNIELVRGIGYPIIFEVSHKSAIENARAISEQNLRVEFGKSPSLRDILYISGGAA